MVGAGTGGWLRKISRYAGPIGKIARTVAGVTSMINSEQKYVDSNQSNQAISNTGFTGSILNAMAQGTTENTRIGNRLLAKNVSINGVLNVGTSAIATRVRVSLILDKKPDQGATSWTDVYSSSADTLSLMNKANGDRYVVLKTLNLNLDNKMQVQQNFKMYCNLSHIHIHYDGTGATLTDFEKNAIFLLCESNESTNTPAITYTSRFRFYDN